ncbi:hypothetical protein [Alishewanella sp. HH-ZS]|uniref:hypothetical protein n=1 Tax=Alishewanella sp. HH-ZS TaxID=1856684 RepID=UPI002100E9D3|nr:hypothetical protein [Alishewanella sp. HH-ZS]
MMLKKYCLLLLAALLLSGCDGNTQLSTQSGSPESVAEAFFDAIYNAKDLDKAKSMATADYAKLLASYGTARQAGRILYNMNFDTVQINVNRSGRNLREQYQNDANIQLILDGEFDGKRVQEVRTVQLIRQRGSWLVSEVQADKFSTSIR